FTFRPRVQYSGPRRASTGRPRYGDRSMTLRTLLALLSGLFTCAALAQEAAPLPDDSPVPGGVAVLEIPTAQPAARAFYEGDRVMLLQRGERQYAVVGVPLAASAGEHTLTVEDAAGERLSIAFAVNPKTYREQHLTIANERQVNPEPQ